jgi:hypothetical protein
VQVRVRGRVREVLEVVVGIFGILEGVGVWLVQHPGRWEFGGRLDGPGNIFLFPFWYVGERGVLGYCDVDDDGRVKFWVMSERRFVGVFDLG